MLENSANKEDIRVEKALAWYFMGCRLLTHEHEHAKSKLEKSLALYHELEDDWHAAQVLHQLFIQSWKSGAHGEGKRIAQQCLALYGKIGYLKGYAGVLGDQGISQLQAGQVSEGMQTITESIEFFEELGDQAGILKGYYYSGMALGFSGQWLEAEERLHSCVSIGEDYCNFFDSVLIALAIIKTHLGKYDEAHTFARSGLERAIELNNQMCIGRAYSALALTALGEGEAETAVEHAQTAVNVYRSFGQNTELGLALAAQGYATCQNGSVIEAQSCFNEALNLATTYKDQLSLLYAFVGIAYLLSYQGLAEQAVETYSAAARHPVVATSQWFQEVVKKRIDDAAASLPPNRIAAAIARGQAIDIETITSALT